MTEQEEHRIRDVYFSSKSDFRRWKWKLARVYFIRLISILICWRRETIYAAFMLEMQKHDSFENLVERYNSKIFKG